MPNPIPSSIHASTVQSLPPQKFQGDEPLMRVPGRQREQSLAGKPAGKRLGWLTALVMLSLILSKLTGQLRDILAVSMFGHGALTDAYTQGFLVPDFVYELLIGGSIQAAIVPTLSADMEKGEGRRGWRSVSIFISFACLVMLGVLLVGELTAPWFMQALTSQETYALATKVTRILFPQTFLMMLAALCIGILNAYSRFERSSFGPVLYNLFVIVSLIAFAAPNASAVMRVAAGVTLSALLFFLFQARMASSELRNFHFSLDYRDAGFQRLLKIALPTLVASAIPQLNNILLNAIIQRADLGLGASTSLRNASTLWMLPWGVFAVAIGQVMLPSLSAYIAAQKYHKAEHLLGQSLRRALFLTLPSMLLFLLYRDDIVRAVFQWHKASYNEHAIALTGSILLFYSFAIVTQAIVFILNCAFYAVGNTKIPLYAALLSMGLTTILGYLMAAYSPMRISGLSFGYTLASAINAAVLFYLYHRRYGYIRLSDLQIFAMQSVICFAVMLVCSGGIAWLTEREGIWIASKLGQLLWIAFRCLLGFLVWFLTAVLLEMPECTYILSRISRMLCRLKGEKS